MTGPLAACVACRKPVPSDAAYCPACGLRQSRDSLAVSQSMRRQVTVLFADLAGFTDASRDADPEDVVEVLNEIFTSLMDECDREDGTLDKTVGDQLMVLFGAPRAHEDDPVRAVRAALNMQTAMDELAPVMKKKMGSVCKLHIGIHTGLVVWGEVGPATRTAPTVIGDAVNLACRLQQTAAGGQILVSEQVYTPTHHLFEYEGHKPIPVKGQPDEIPVYVPLRAREHAHMERQPSETNLPFIERQPELTMLQACWSRALVGDPQAILLTGGAGLGKSRLMAEFHDSLGSLRTPKRPVVLRAWCESGRTGDYEPLTSLLLQLFDIARGDTPLARQKKVEDRGQELGI